MDIKHQQELVLNQALIDEICARLQANKRVHRVLPGEGLLHLDRQLPFLCVYRRPTLREDPLTSRLVRSEAAYLIMPAQSYKSRYRKLLERIIATLSPKFGAFLLFQLWAGAEVEEEETLEPEALRPDFEIFADTSGELISTSETLEARLKKIMVHKKKARVTLHYTRMTGPPEMYPLLPKSHLLSLNSHSMGLSIQPIYRNLESNEAYPLVFRGLHRGLSIALRQAFFEFTRSNTRQRPPHFHSLGPRAVTKSVLEIDHRLAAIASAYDFLLLATPINTQSSWRSFKKQGCDRPPALHYRPLPIDPSELKKALYSINLNRVGDPTLSDMFHRKRSEIDRELTMLSERGSQNFLLGSFQLYGRVDSALLSSAHEILDAFPERSRDETFSGRYSAAAFAQRAQVEIDRFHALSPDTVAPQVTITDDVTGLMCSQGDLLVGASVRIPKNRIEALIQHEVGTHILTRLNGRQQPFRLLAGGLNGYDELQEGMAVLAEYLVGQLSRSRLRLLAGRAVAARYIDDGASFIETYRQLVEAHDFEERTAFRITVRIFRGGGLVKDAIYLRGLIRLLNYLTDNGDLNLLFTGKFSLEHIPIISELLHRKVLTPAKLTPSYMNSPAALKRLKRLRAGLSPIDLIPTGKR